MHYSTNNVIVELDKEDDYRYTILNALTGQVDFLDPPYYQCLLKTRESENVEFNADERMMQEQMAARGYLYKTKQEEEHRTSQFIDHLIKAQDERKGNIYALTPGNRCNEGCSYCSHKERLDSGYIDEDKLEKIIRIISENEKKCNAPKKPVLALYGGEGLPDSDDGYRIIEKILLEYTDLFSKISFYTFDANLERYRDLILKSDMKKLSFSFRLLENEDSDPTELFTAKSEAAFDFLRLKGIATSLTLKITEDNVNRIPDYMDMLVDKGIAFSNNCRMMFKPTVKGNCSVFSPCTVNYSLYKRIFEIYEENPLLEYATFFGHGILQLLQVLIRMRERFSPRRFYCEANWNLHVFRPSGDIYSCYHADSKALAVGNINDGIDETALAAWRNRQVDVLEACSHCAAKFICSGGCSYEALEKTGSINSPNCQPYENIIKWGFEHLYEDFMDSERYESIPEDPCEDA